MKVLVIGSGAREHALCWRLRQSPLLEELYCAPGNPGIAEIADLVPRSVGDVMELADFAEGVGVDLTVVGPELPLTLGLVDEFQRRGLAAFGPRRDAAELEGSKVFAKRFMERHGIPTADFRVVHDAAGAEEAASELGLPVVLKADGLAAGKGVLIVRDADELADALSILFSERRFGAASEQVVVEQCLEGEEVSMIALSDGDRLLPMATSKDYKRIGEGDTGPNTGGMGAHSPSGVVSANDAAGIVDTIMRPTIAGMAKENRPFAGVLYAGLMLTAEGPRVLEYNVRFGDPEAQPLMMRLESDLLPVLAAGARGGFGDERLQFRKEAAACIVLASAGYPESPVKGEAIQGLGTLADRPGIEVFHAGTAASGEDVVVAGGRVLSVCATGARLVDALKQAYAAAAEIRWPSKVLRKDIGRRVVESTAEPR